jgi:F420-non-reducing hydrogenase small subunit
VELPKFSNTVRALDQVVDVEYYIPGCAPTPKIILAAVQTLLSGELPPKGSVLASDRALCEECPRRDTRPEKLTLSEFKRPHEILIDEEECLLAQGLLCLGPADNVHDYGGKALSAIASIVDSTDEKEIDGILSKIPDPMGTLYRYSLPASLLRRKKLATAPK